MKAKQLFGKHLFTKEKIFINVAGKRLNQANRFIILASLFYYSDFYKSSKHTLFLGYSYWTEKSFFPIKGALFFINGKKIMAAILEND